MRTREENDYRATRSARILKPQSKYKRTNLNSDGSSGCGKEEMTVRNKGCEVSAKCVQVGETVSTGKWDSRA